MAQPHQHKDFMDLILTDHLCVKCKWYSPPNENKHCNQCYFGKCYFVKKAGDNDEDHDPQTSTEEFNP